MSKVWETDLPYHWAVGVPVNSEYAFVGFLDVLALSKATRVKAVSVAKGKKVRCAMVDVLGSSKEGEGKRGRRRLSSDTEPAKEPSPSRQDEQDKGVEKKDKTIANGIQRVTSSNQCVHDWVLDTENSSKEIEAYKCSKCGAPASVRFMKKQST